jgi:hypothetical protein
MQYESLTLPLTLPLTSHSPQLSILLELGIEFLGAPCERFSPLKGEEIHY